MTKMKYLNKEQSEKIFREGFVKYDYFEMCAFARWARNCEKWSKNKIEKHIRSEFFKKGLNIVLKTACRKDDVVHLNIFMPLTRFNEYSICIAADLEIPCAANLSTYTLDYPTYSEKTDKLQIIHSRLGFIEKSKYKIIYYICKMQLKYFLR